MLLSLCGSQCCERLLEMASTLIPIQGICRGFFACSDCFWEQIFVGKRLRLVSKMMGKRIPRLTGNKVDVFRRALDSLS